MTTRNLGNICHPNRISSMNLFLFLGFIFLLNPFASLACGTLLLLLKKKPATADLRFWMALMALWISLVNITKVPASDQIMYQTMFARYAHHDLWDGLFAYTGIKSKEPVYGLYQYICYHLFWGNDKLFFLTSSFISYYVLSLAVSTILLKAGQGVKAVIFGVICCTFFNQFFYLSIHLLRQIMAFSIVLYAVALKAEDGRNHWIPLICAPLIHTTTGIFAILALFPFIYHRMNLREYLIILCPLLIVTVGSIAFGSMMTAILGDNSATSYAFRRMTTNLDDGVASNPLVVAIMITPLSIIALINLKRLSKNKKLFFNSPLYPIIYLFLFLAIMVLSLSARPVMQYRFVFVTYQFLPFLLPLLIPKKSVYRSPYFIIVGAFFIIRFLLTFNNSAWTYKLTAIDMLTWPAPFYFFAL